MGSFEVLTRSDGRLDRHIGRYFLEARNIPSDAHKTRLLARLHATGSSYQTDWCIRAMGN